MSRKHLKKYSYVCFKLRNEITSEKEQTVEINIKKKSGIRFVRSVELFLVFQFIMLAGFLQSLRKEYSDMTSII